MKQQFNLKLCLAILSFSINSTSFTESYEICVASGGGYNSHSALKEHNKASLHL